LSAKTDELEGEADTLRDQSQSAASERADLAAKVQQLETELQELRQLEAKSKEDGRQLIAAKFERDEWKARYEKLDAERSAAEKELREIRSEVEMNRERLWAPPGHPYSPVTDPHDPFVLQTEILNLQALKDNPELAIDDAAMLRLLDWLGEHGGRFPFGPSPRAELRYHTGNGHFGHADAAVLFGMLLEYKPIRYIELGCGYASLLAMDTNDKFLGRGVDMTFFDPRPDVILSLLRSDDPYRGQVHARRSQDVPDRIFQELQRGDILSLETSHVAKTGSDVCDILFRVLPSLAPGVLVHIHDIFFPFEYPEAWVVQDNRSWNEAYLLRAFLQYNNAFRVLFFNNLMVRKYGDEVRAALPKVEDTHASGLWLEKVG
jgi:hypothetical protein